MNDQVEVIENGDEYLKSLGVVTNPSQKTDAVLELSGQEADDFLASLKPVDVTTGDNEAAANASFIEKTKKDFAARGQNVETMMESYSPIMQLPNAKLLGVLGQGIGVVSDVIGNTLGSAFGNVADSISFLISDEMEESIKEGLKEGLDFVFNNELGRTGIEAAQGGIEEYSKFRTKFPAEARLLESIVNIAAIINPVKAKEMPFNFDIGTADREGTRPSDRFIQILREMPPNRNNEGLLARYAKYLDYSADKTLQDVAADMIKPKQTAARMEDQVSRTTVSGGGTKKYIPDNYEVEMANELAKSGIKRTRNIQVNYNIVAKKIKEEAKQLSKSLSRYNNVRIPSQYIKDKIENNALRELSKDVIIASDSSLQAVVAKTQEAFNKIIDKYPKTPLGMLEARQEFDGTIKKQLGDSFFKSEKETVALKVVGAFRRVLNDTIEEFAPDAQVKESLRKQSLKFNALENMRPKAAEQASTAVGRLWGNIHKKIAVKRDANIAIGGVVGAGVMATATNMLPYLAAGLSVVAVSTAFKKGYTSPAMRKGLATLLRQADKAIAATKNAAEKSQLTADRLVVIELLTLPVQEEEQPQ